MSILLQIMLINLIVSFDNIGVIALATRGLDNKKANQARQLGIWLSLVLKFIFVIFIGYLFAVPWLHIRLLGGLMLIYVVYGMLGDGAKKEGQPPKRFSYVILSIIAADISMSIDNVIAVLSVVSGENGEITIAGLSMVFLGLALSVPILLWFSDSFMRWMARFGLLRYICAGYLAFIAAQMIFQDDFMANLFVYIRFPYPGLLAASLGIFTAALSWRIEAKAQRANGCG